VKEPKEKVNDIIFNEKGNRSPTNVQFGILKGRSKTRQKKGALAGNGI
jgi:hypothetical protein